MLLSIQINLVSWLKVLYQILQYLLISAFFSGEKWVKYEEHVRCLLFCIHRCTHGHAKPLLFAPSGDNPVEKYHAEFFIYHTKLSLEPEF